MKDKIVEHKTYGTGTVTDIKDGFISVNFSGEIKTFIFPDCFENVLSAVDDDFKAFVKMSINNRNAEKRLIARKGLNRRIPDVRGRAVSRWSNSYTENRKAVKRPIVKNVRVESCFDKTPKKPPVKINDYKRYNGRNGFLVICNSTYEDEQNSGCTIISKVDLSGEKKPYLDFALSVKEGDVLFHILNSEVKSVSIASDNAQSDDTDYIINSQYIPIMGSVNIFEQTDLQIAVNKYNPELKKGIVPLPIESCKDLVRKINSVCPYISGIEGINDFV